LLFLEETHKTTWAVCLMPKLGWSLNTSFAGFAGFAAVVILAGFAAGAVFVTFVGLDAPADFGPMILVVEAAGGP